MTSTTLGPYPSLRFISGNTALPPAPDSPPASQPTHNDADFDHLGIPFALVINVPLVAMTPNNGSTEIWLGTHNNTTVADQDGEHGDRASGRIKTHLLRQMKELRGPSQPHVKKGSVIIRDLRLWHGGKPNLSTEPRVMLAMSKSVRVEIVLKFQIDGKQFTLLLGTGIKWKLNSRKVSVGD